MAREFLLADCDLLLASLVLDKARLPDLWSPPQLCRPFFERGGSVGVPARELALEFARELFGVGSALRLPARVGVDRPELL